MNVKCNNCGKEDDVSIMVSFNTGRTTKYLCWECYKLGTSEVHCAEYARRIRISKANEKEK